jgi:hypothetical protein
MVQQDTQIICNVAIRILNGRLIGGLCHLQSTSLKNGLTIMSILSIHALSTRCRTSARRAAGHRPDPPARPRREHTEPIELTACTTTPLTLRSQASSVQPFRREFSFLNQMSSGATCPAQPAGHKTTKPCVPRNYGGKPRTQAGQVV